MIRTRFSSILVLVICGAVFGVNGAGKDEGVFHDKSGALGIKPGNSAAAWADFNNDGWEDVYTGGSVWVNSKGKTFTKLKVSGRGTAADFDNDGWVDIYSYSKQKLWRNINGSKFSKTDMVKLPKVVSNGACWADFDNDGFADIYIGGYEDYKAGVTYTDMLLINKAGKCFNIDSRIDGHRARGVTACDFDEDGDIDVYVSNYRLQPNLLLINDGKGNLTDRAAEYNARASSGEFKGGHSIGACWADFDNDGHFDLFAGNFAHDDSRGDQPESRFLRNGGPEKGYRFTDLGQRGVWYQESYASCAAGDYDNDGDVDLYFTTVYGTASFGKKNHPVLFRNEGGWRFTDVTQKAGLAGLGPTYQAAWADFDNDGDLDLISDGKLFVNGGNENHWLKVRLRGDGAKINKNALGAQVRIKTGDQVLTRQVEAGTGEGNQNSMILHFGLGGHNKVIDVQVIWPDGRKKVMESVGIDSTVEVEYISKPDPGSE